MTAGTVTIYTPTASPSVRGCSWEDPDLRDAKELDGDLPEHFGQKVAKTDLAVTEK